ncbi:MAG: hypothetical protein QQN46_09310 [Nitrosopumilus sp.]
MKVGQWVRVQYDDVGVRDGIVVEKDHRDDPKPLSCKVFFPTEGLDIIERDQLIRTGKILHTMDTGLDG